jgi:hypothetical protein
VLTETTIFEQWAIEATATSTWPSVGGVNDPIQAVGPANVLPNHGMVTSLRVKFTMK